MNECSLERPACRFLNDEQIVSQQRNEWTTFVKTETVKSSHSFLIIFCNLCRTIVHELKKFWKSHILSRLIQLRLTIIHLGQTTLHIHGGRHKEALILLSYTPTDLFFFTLLFSFLLESYIFLAHLGKTDLFKMVSKHFFYCKLNRLFELEPWKQMPIFFLFFFVFFFPSTHYEHAKIADSYIPTDLPTNVRFLLEGTQWY